MVRNVSAALGHQGLTRRAFAEAVGYSEDQVGNYLRGEVWLDLRQIARLEQALNHDLVSGTRPDIVHHRNARDGRLPDGSQLVVDRTNADACCELRRFLD